VTGGVESKCQKVDVPVLLSNPKKFLEIRLSDLAVHRMIHDGSLPGEPEATRSSS